MSDNRTPGKPDPRELDGVLNELRSVLSNLSDVDAPETAAAPPAEAPAIETPIVADVPPAVESLPSVEPPLESLASPQPRPTPIFEVIRPAEPPVAVPPIPRGIEAAPDNWALPAETRGRDVPPPVVDGPAVPPAPTPTWLQTEAGIVPENDGRAAEPATAPLDPADFAVPVPPPVDDAAGTFLPPMPGTVETRAPAAAAEPAALDLEAPEPRPDGLVQVACLFPEGEEKTGQAFMNKLRDAASRLRKPITIQPVFLHTWLPSAVDVAAWSKSAVLSGADAMFVLAPRASAALFSAIAHECRESGAIGRMIALEHVTSPALYADVLVELRKVANGPR